MNSKNIFDLLMSNEDVKKQFKGILASDQLNIFQIERPALYVVNTDTSNNAGIHWVCIYFPDSNKNVGFFDPLAKSPEMYNIFISTFLTANSSNIMYSNKRIQNYFTNSCGVFCVLFAMLRCNKKSFLDILLIFTNDLEKNEKVVQNYVKQLV